MPLAPEYLNILPAWLQKQPGLADEWVVNYIEAGGDANGESGRRDFCPGEDRCQ